MGQLVTDMPGRGSKPRWLVLLRPKWLCWHLFAVVGFFGMLWLGDWQLHRALSGNQLSWAYTFEWPLFAIFGVYFWWKTVRDELRTTANASNPAAAAADSAGEQPPADEEAARQAYLARLQAEIRATHGRRHNVR